MEAGDFASAATSLRRAVQLRDDDPGIWFLLGQAEQRNNRVGEAFNAFNRADELKPGDPDTLRSIAYTGYMIGAVKDSLGAAERLLTIAPDDASALSVKGLIALDGHDTKTALKAADAILRANPADETGILLKARAIAVAGNVDAAQTLLAEAIARSGQTPGLLALSLQIHRLAGNVEGLRVAYPALMKASPGNADLYVDYANFLYRTGDAAKARTILADGMIKEMRTGPYLAWAFRILDRYEPVNLPPRLDPRLARQPASLLRTMTARYLLERGDAAGSATLVSSTGTVDARDRGIYAAALDAMGKRKAAEAIVSELLAPGDAHPDTEALVLRARWRLAAGERDRAATDAQAAVLGDPSNVRARLLLAQVYAAAGDDLRVRQVLGEAMQDMPHNRRILAAFLDFLHRKGDKDTMLGVVRAFADANPADPESWGMVVNLCAASGNTACAEAARARMRLAMRDFDMPNPSRPNVERGLFSPIKRPV